MRQPTIGGRVQPPYGRDTLGAAVSGVFWLRVGIDLAIEFRPAICVTLHDRIAERISCNYQR